jgi:DNA-binding NarL/FixJ family response regulator
VSIRVIVADDHSIVRKGIKAEMSQYEDLILVGEAASLDDAFQTVQTAQPDVIVLDIHLAELRAAEMIHRIKAHEKPIRVIVFTLIREPSIVLDVMKAGADGYLLKDEEIFSIPDAIHRVMKGQVCICLPIAKILVNEVRDPAKNFSKPTITEKEKQVLQHLAEGWSNKEIAQRTGMAVRTVEAHISKIYGKLGTTSRAKAVLWAKENGLIK